MTPTSQHAIAIVERHLQGAGVRTIARFPTGAAHYVYDAELTDGRRVVARLGRIGQEADFAGAVFWHGELVPRGVPLPRLLGYNAHPTPGAFPFVLLERLPGTDLGHVYPDLSVDQKRDLAWRVVAIQRVVGELPEGRGFGYGTRYDDPALLPAWPDVVACSLERSRSRITGVGMADPSVVDRVAAALVPHAGALAAVRPRPFLDDTTTKNVLVHRGRLSGIVDVDVVCFGDPRWTLALTRMALLVRGFDLDYAAAWAAEMDLDAAAHDLVRVYTAVFCVDFLGELGQRFNRDAPAPVDPAEVARLVGILDGLVGG